MMVGRELKEIYPKTTIAHGDVALEVKGFWKRKKNSRISILPFTLEKY